MKKLILSVAIIGMTAFAAQSAFAGEPGCKGKGCTCSGSCKDNKCTMACCGGKDAKECKKGEKCCNKDTKSTDSKQAPTNNSNGSSNGK